jgi:hypothetical protein
VEKISKKEIIQAIVNNEDGKTDKQIALKLGITPEWFCTLKKRYADDIYKEQRLYIRQLIGEQVKNLRRNAQKGDTAAAKFLIELTEKTELAAVVKELQEDMAKIKQLQAERYEMKVVKTGTDG